MRISVNALIVENVNNVEIVWIVKCSIMHGAESMEYQLREAFEAFLQVFDSFLKY
jgi:hypothetical protein